MRVFFLWSNAGGFLVGFAVAIILLLFLSYLIPSSPANAFGRFIGTPSATWLEDGRLMKLNQDFLFIDPNGKAWLAPASSVIDGASIPRPFWSLIGGPFEGRYRNASVVHDVACERRVEPSEDVHRMFYFACRCGGVDEKMAKILYLAVRLGGPQWKIAYEIRTTPNGKTVQVGKAVDVFEGLPLAPRDVQAVQAFIEKNPTLEEIETVRLENGELKVKVRQ